MLHYYPCVVTIAGSDSSGGAGIQADIKAISATGSYAASIITALTAQNTQGVQGIFPIPPEFIAQQIESVFTDLPVKAVKIGMLFDNDIIKIIADQLKKFKPDFIILDPVMVAKSGSLLLKLDTIVTLKEHLLPLATLITPNIPECETLMNAKINNPADMELFASNMGKEFNTNILIKGGHLKSAEANDVLYSFQESRCHWFHEKRISTQHTHGTGCTLAAAIASYLAQNYSLVDSITLAKKYLSYAILAGTKHSFGKGQGPVDHFYFLRGRDDS